MVSIGTTTEGDKTICALYLHCTLLKAGIIRATLI